MQLNLLSVNHCVMVMMSQLNGWDNCSFICICSHWIISSFSRYTFPAIYKWSATRHKFAVRCKELKHTVYILIFTIKFSLLVFLCEMLLNIQKACNMQLKVNLEFHITTYSQIQIWLIHCKMWCAIFFLHFLCFIFRITIK